MYPDHTTRLLDKIIKIVYICMYVLQLNRISELEFHIYMYMHTYLKHFSTFIWCIFQVIFSFYLPILSFIPISIANNFTSNNVPHSVSVNYIILLNESRKTKMENILNTKRIIILKIFYCTLCKISAWIYYILHRESYVIRMLY